jgi:hypothetical protein
MPHEGELTAEVRPARRDIVVGKGMVAWKVPGRGDLGRPRTGSTGKPRRPCLRARRVENLGAPGEVCRKIGRVVEVVMVIVKIPLVALVHSATRCRCRGCGTSARQTPARTRCVSRPIHRRPAAEQRPSTRTPVRAATGADRFRLKGGWCPLQPASRDRWTARRRLPSAISSTLTTLRRTSSMSSRSHRGQHVVQFPACSAPALL